MPEPFWDNASKEMSWCLLAQVPVIQLSHWLAIGWRCCVFSYCLFRALCSLVHASDSFPSVLLQVHIFAFLHVRFELECRKRLWAELACAFELCFADYLAWLRSCGQGIHVACGGLCMPSPDVEVPWTRNNRCPFTLTGHFCPLFCCTCLF